MSRIEDLLREATQESGASVEPGSLPGLDLSRVRYDGRKRVFRVGPGPGGILARRDLALPAMAAVVLVVVVALSLALTGVLRAHSGGGPGPATNGQGPGPSGVPRYYVTGSGPQPSIGSGPQSSGSPVSAEVVDSTTGSVLAVVKPPPGVASFVAFGSGSSDDRTFAVAAVQHSGDSVATRMHAPLTFFLLRFDSVTRQATLQAVPALTGPFVTAGNVAALAVSPDGSRLAVSDVGLESGPALDEEFSVSVISLSPGSSWRTWHSAFSNNASPLSPFIWALEPEYDSGAEVSLSWMPGSRVLVLGIPQEAVLLDTTRPAGDLLGSGQQVVLATRLAPGTGKGNYFECDSPASLSGDGTALACFGQLDNAANPNLAPPIVGEKADTLANAIGRFSAATGRLLSLTVLPGPYTGPRLGGPGLGGVAWSNAAGDILVTSRTNGPPYTVVGGRVDVTKSKQRTTMIVVSHGVAKAIPGPAWAATSPNFFPFALGVGW